MNDFLQKIHSFFINLLYFCKKKETYGSVEKV